MRMIRVGGLAVAQRCSLRWTSLRRRRHHPRDHAILEAGAPSVDPRCLCEDRRDTLGKPPPRKLRHAANPAKQPSCGDGSAPPPQRRPAFLEGRVGRKATADASCALTFRKARERKSDRNQRVPSESRHLTRHHEHHAPAQDAEKPPAQHRKRRRTPQNTEQAQHFALTSAVTVQLKLPAYGPARAAAVRAVKRPNLVRRGRRVCQLLISTELRINLRLLRGLTTLPRSTTGSEPAKVTLPVTYFWPHRGMLLLLASRATPSRARTPPRTRRYASGWSREERRVRGFRQPDQNGW